jgi:hypothetical protein
MVRPQMLVSVYFFFLLESFQAKRIREFSFRERPKGGIKGWFLLLLIFCHLILKSAMLHDSLRVLVYANSKQLARSFD